MRDSQLLLYFISLIVFEGTLDKETGLSPKTELSIGKRIKFGR